MKIILNNRPEELPGDSMNIDELLLYMRFSFRQLVIKVNGQLVRKDEFTSTFVREGDQVIILHLISGG